MSPSELAAMAARLGEKVEATVFGERKSADRVVSGELRARRNLTASDRAILEGAAWALCRWRGWVSRLGLETIEARLLVSTILDALEVSQVARAWARRVKVDPGRLFALGDAPDWAARAQGLRHLLDNPKVATDPWLLFPSWLKASLPEPPGDEAPKHKLVGFLSTLQKPAPRWVRARGERPEAEWSRLRDLGRRPWVIRGMGQAARLDAEHATGSVDGVRLVAEDLATQLVARVCDPSPGERWWVTDSGDGEAALDLADRMGGKGTIVATDRRGAPRKELAERFRSAGRSNFTPRDWDGRHVPGRALTFHGVLVEPPSSGIGNWRREPDARWLVDGDDVLRFADDQVEGLGRASKGVRPGGTLVYAVRTLSLAETLGVVERFSATHTGFRPDPFPAPPWTGGVASNGVLTMWPGRDLDMEPAFVARWLRVGSGDA